MKLLSIVSCLLVILISSSLEPKNNFVQKEGYYFRYQMSYRLGNSEIWILNSYNGFIEKEMWNKNKKVNICGFPVEEPSTFSLVKQENQYTIEKDYIDRILLGQKTKLDSLITLLNKSTKIFYQSKNRKTKLQIIYGSFKFKQIEGSVEEYEDEIYSSPHKKIRIDVNPKTRINFIKLVDYKDIKLLSAQEVKKIRVKKRPCN